MCHKQYLHKVYMMTQPQNNTGKYLLMCVHCTILSADIIRHYKSIFTCIPFICSI